MKKLSTLIFSLLAFVILMPEIVSAQGEDCSSATIIPGIPFNITYNNSTYKDDYNAVCPYNVTGGLDAVFIYTPTVTSIANVYTCDAAGSTNFDTKIYIYQNTCPPTGLPSGDGSEVACSEDACSGPSFPNPWLSRISNFQFVAGNDYYIVVDAYSGTDIGTVTLDIQPSASLNDLAVSTGFYGSSYSCLPYSQVKIPDTAVAVLQNNGTTSFSNVTATLDVFCDGDTTPAYSDTATGIDVPIGGSVAIGYTGFNLQTDSNKLYTFCFTHDQVDDTASNDTLYDFILVNDSIWCNDLFLLGATPSAFSIVGSTPQSELAALYVPEAKDTLSSVTVLLATDVVDIGTAVSVCVYDGIDTVPIATSNTIIVDTSEIFYTFLFEGGVCLFEDSLYLISVKSGNIPVGATTVLPTSFSSWGRNGPGDSWGFFTGLDWMIWANLGDVFVQSCPAPLTNTTNIGLTEATLTWSQVPGALGYEISGGLAGSNPANYITIEVTGGAVTQYLATALQKGKSYEWRIRAACDVVNGQPVYGPYSELTFFTTLACTSVDPISTTNITATSATLNWTTIPAAIGYVILGQQVNPPAGGVVELQVPGGGVSSYNASGLLPNTTYAWGAFAVCDLSPYVNGPFSATQAFVTNAVPKTSDYESVEDMLIFPNPANSSFTIKFNSNIDAEQVRVEITDLSGKVMLADYIVSGNQMNFSGENLSSGVYQVNVQTDEWNVTRKLVIQK